MLLVYVKSLAASYKIKHIPTIRALSPTPRYQPPKMKADVHTKTDMSVFIEAFFIGAKSKNTTRCQTMGEWIKSLWTIHTMEYYSVITRNELNSVCVCVCVCVCVSSSVLSNSLQPHGLYLVRLLCLWILQASILKWVAIPFSRGSSQPRDQTPGWRPAQMCPAFITKVHKQFNGGRIPFQKRKK